MKYQLVTSLLLLLLLSSINQVYAYLGERHSPFIITLDKRENLKFKRGDTVQIHWGLTPGVRFPLYGYASARTSKTDGAYTYTSAESKKLTYLLLIVGLLTPESSRTEAYSYTIDTDVNVLDYTYTWTIDDKVPTGKYQIGVGFFYHEVSPIIHIID